MLLYVKRSNVKSDHKIGMLIGISGKKEVVRCHFTVLSSLLDVPFQVLNVPFLVFECFLPGFGCFFPIFRVFPSKNFLEENTNGQRVVIFSKKSIDLCSRMFSLFSYKADVEFVPGSLYCNMTCGHVEFCLQMSNLISAEVAIFPQLVRLFIALHKFEHGIYDLKQI